MKIQVGGLSEGLHSFRFEARAADLRLGESFPGVVTIDVQVEKTGHQLALNGTVKTVGAFECDRCVARFTRPLVGRYRMHYLQDGTDAKGLDPSEVQAIPAGQSIIDIRDDVRQTVLLSVPLKVLCREDCKGLCPKCGGNLNERQCNCRDTAVDSRWDKLRSLPRN